MTRVLTAHDLTPLAAAPSLPLAAVLAVKIATVITEWHYRKRSRNALARLDDHMLEDIGLTYRQARTEARRPFWQV